MLIYAVPRKLDSVPLASRRLAGRIAGGDTLLDRQQASGFDVSMLFGILTRLLYRLCGSGFQAAVNAVQEIRLGESHVGH